jgi:hypothetical protein
MGGGSPAERSAAAVCPGSGSASYHPAMLLGLLVHGLRSAVYRITRSLDERFAGAPPAPKNPTPLEAMAHRLATPEGKKLYARRKHTPEPVFGIIKSVLGFRQFLLRGLDKVRGEWNLAAAMTPVDSQPSPRQLRRYHERPHHPLLAGHDHDYRHQRHRADARLGPGLRLSQLSDFRGPA